MISNRPRLKAMALACPENIANTAILGVGVGVGIGI
jgi:hypothetical protein